MNRVIPRTLTAWALTLLPGLALAQQPATVTGVVTDARSQPLSAVSVSIEAMRLGGYTDEAGRYSFTVPAENARGQTVTLSARRLGFAPKSMQIALTGGTVTADFTLEESAHTLPVVTALGIEKTDKAVTASVASVRGEEVAEARETNIVNALVGKVPGAVITNAGPQGGSSRIVLRGANSIAGNNQPLFVVDGIPIDNSSPRLTGGGGIDYGNGAADINPNDVETITVLRGPNAAALYGSRAANGVIMITTKSGRSSTGMGISASMNVTFEDPLRLPDYQNSYGQGCGGQFDFVDGRGGGVCDGTDESWGPPLDGRSTGCKFIPSTDPRYNPAQPRTYDTTAPCRQFFSGGAAAPWVPAPNNVSDFFETGVTRTTSAALSGRTERAHARFSVTNQDLDGTYPGNELRRINAALNGGALVGSRVEVTGHLQYVNGDGENRPGIGYNIDNVMQQFVWFGRQVDVSRLRNYRDAEGEMYNWNYNYHNNPYWLALENDNFDSRDRVIGSGTLNYTFNPWLKGTFRAGTDWFRDWRKRTYAVGTVDAPGGFFDENNLFRQESNLEALLTAQRSFMENLGLTLTFGGNRRYNTYRRTYQGSNDLIAPGIYSIGNSEVNATPAMREERKQVNSLLGSAAFSYNDYLFVELTGRNDWSSTLPEGNNSYFYPSIGTSLVFTEAFPSLTFGGVMNYGKLRGGWTRVGNDADPYQLQSVYTPNTTFGPIARYAAPDTILNPTLKPEETTAWEAGAELEFLDNRVGVDVTYYDKSTANQILGVQLSASTGFRNKILNAGRISNKGIEATLRLTPVSLANSFQWDVTTTYARNRSKVEELFGDLETVVLGTYWGLTVQARKGEPYGAMVGTAIRRDAQGNAVIGANGRWLAAPSAQVLGNYNPDWTGSLLNQFRFKNFDLSVLLDTKQGGELFSVTHMFGRYAGVLEETVVGRDTGIVVPGVTTTGAPNTVRITAEQFNHSFYPMHEASIFDASFIKLREVKLGWQVPETLSSRIGIASAYVAFTGRNLWLSTDVPHIDPETAFDASNVQGLEFGQFPSQRSYGIHLSVTR